MTFHNFVKISYNQKYTVHAYNIFKKYDALSGKVKHQSKFISINSTISTNLLFYDNKEVFRIV